MEQKQLNPGMTRNERKARLRRAVEKDAAALADLINRAFEVEREFLPDDRVNLAHVAAAIAQGTFLLLDTGSELQGAVFL